MKRDLLVAGAVLGGLYLLFKGSLGLLNKINWSFKGIDIDGIGISEGLALKMGVMLEIDNGSQLTIPIEKFTGAVYYKGNLLTPVQSAAYTEVKAGKKTVLRYIVPISKDTITRIWGSSWAEALKNFKDSIRPSNYRLTGEVNFRLGNVLHIYKIDEPFSYS
jgi:hypothetical protein